MQSDFQTQIENKASDELLQIYSDADQYQDDYIKLIEVELEKRAVDFTKQKLLNQHKESFMLQQAEKGKAGDLIFISLGYISALFGGLPGIIAGYVYSQSKNKEWGDGSYYYYDLKTRNLGTGMMSLGIAVLVTTLLYTFT